MLKLFRWLMGVNVCLSREDALQVAKKYCESHQWPWLEPLHMVLGVRYYEIMTNAEFKGGNVTLQIDCSNGDVVTSTYAKR